MPYKCCHIVKFIMVRVGNKSNQSQFFPGLTANTKKPGAAFIKIKTFLDSGECCSYIDNGSNIFL